MWYIKIDITAEYLDYCKWYNTNEQIKENKNVQPILYFDILFTEVYQNAGISYNAAKHHKTIWYET